MEPRIVILEPVELETLERLCERGELVLYEGSHFYPAEALILSGCASRLVRHGKTTHVVPTDLGRELCAVRLRLKQRTKFRDAPPL